MSDTKQLKQLSGVSWGSAPDGHGYLTRMTFVTVGDAKRCAASVGNEGTHDGLTWHAKVEALKNQKYKTRAYKE